jgi:hypothetical protein
MIFYVFLNYISITAKKFLTTRDQKDSILVMYDGSFALHKQVIKFKGMEHKSATNNPLISRRILKPKILHISETK